MFALLAAVCASAAHILVSLGGIQPDKGFIAFWCVFIGTLVLIIFTIATGGMKKIRSMSFVDGICLILAGIAYPLAYDFYGRAVSMSGSYAGYILIDDYCDDDMLQRDTEGEGIGKEIPGRMHFYCSIVCYSMQLIAEYSI